VRRLRDLRGHALLGLAFDLPGDGRIGFLVLGAVWMLAALATPYRTEFAPVAGRSSA
jgi:hypothetical protein